jgi:hypothetical protein
MTESILPNKTPLTLRHASLLLGLAFDLRAGLLSLLIRGPSIRLIRQRTPPARYDKLVRQGTQIVGTGRMADRHR